MRKSFLLSIAISFYRAILGLAYCGVIGNAMRKYYTIIGPSVDRAVKIMSVSYDKVVCFDPNTFDKCVQLLNVNHFHFNISILLINKISNNYILTNYMFATLYSPYSKQVFTCRASG